MADSVTEPTPLWCTCEKPLPVHLADRKGAARSVCARCERPLRLTFRLARSADRERDRDVCRHIGRPGLDGRRRILRRRAPPG